MGFLSIWYMLPTARPRQLIFGMLGGVVALIGFGVFVVVGLDRQIPVSAEGFLFASFSLMAIAFAGIMIAQRNPARAAISFALVVLNVCGLFLLLAAPFLMAATIIIYAGAIIVTFLFVIMLSHQSGYTDANDRSREPSLSAAVGFLLLATLLIVLQRVYNTREIEDVIAQADRYAKADAIDENLKRDGNAGLKSFQADVNAALTQLLGVKQSDLESETFLNPPASDIVRASNGLAGDIGMEDVGSVKLNMAEIRDKLSYLKSVRDGFVNPHPEVVLSPYGQAVTLEPGAPHQLPAANVSALGRVLYTEHLLAIELAGTLLLVATIGTIAIAGGRREKTP
jgi:NADH:ubiquinone oxidoreductase subunit 6 (subunit J)